MKAFQHFDRTLGIEHRTRTEKDIEAGVVEAPKAKKKPAGKMGPTRRSRDRNGKTTLEISVDPKFTAAAALTAARRGTTTHKVAAEWLETLAFADVPEDPRERIVTFTMHLAVGPDAFPPDVFKDLCKFADEIGVSPSRLATGIVKQAIAKWQLEAIPATN